MRQAYEELLAAAGMPVGMMDEILTNGLVEIYLVVEVFGMRSDVIAVIMIGGILLAHQCFNNNRLQERADSLFSTL